MRVALCIHRDNLEKAFETYHHIANKDFIHATPTLFNAVQKKRTIGIVLFIGYERRFSAWYL